MSRSRPLLRVLLTLLAFAIAAMPVSGAHLHLCFDGGEQPATLHLAEDGGQHSDPGAHGKHNDADLELGAPAIAKKASAGADLPVLATLAVVLFHVPASSPPVLPQSDDTAVVVFSAYRILPPLRAPPV